jgi:hypothetical protein
MEDTMAKCIVAAFCLFSCLFFAFGCTTPGGGFFNTNTPNDAKQAPVNYEQTILQHLNHNLIDPRSMYDFSVSHPILTSCSVGIYGPFHGWRVTTKYNAKNRLGGYVGLQTYYYWFHGEKLVGINQNPNLCPEAPTWK